MTTEGDLIRRAMNCIEQAEEALSEPHTAHLSNQWLLIADKWLHIYENIDLTVLNDDEAEVPDADDNADDDEEDFDFELDEDDDEDPEPKSNHRGDQEAALRVIGEGWGILGVPDSTEPPQND